jgi:hypothetical protein
MLYLRRDFKSQNGTEYRRVVFRISPSQFRISTPTPAVLTEVLCGSYSTSNKMPRLATNASYHILPQSIIHKHLHTSQYNGNKYNCFVCLEKMYITIQYLQRRLTYRLAICLYWLWCPCECLTLPVGTPTLWLARRDVHLTLQLSDQIHLLDGSSFVYKNAELQKRLCRWQKQP